jgi:hypothetical protein
MVRAAGTVSGHGFGRGNQDLNPNQDQTQSHDYQPRPRHLYKHQLVVNLLAHLRWGF